jgi:hypothetical protein
MDFLITNRQEAEVAERQAKKDIEDAQRGIDNATDSVNRLGFMDQLSAAEADLRDARAALEKFPDYA